MLAWIRLTLLWFAATAAFHCTPQILRAQGDSAAEETPDVPEKAAAKIDPKLKAKLGKPNLTMEGFISAVNEDRQEDALQFLDLSNLALNEEVRRTKGWEYAWKLKETIDRMVRVNYTQVQERAVEDRFQLLDLDHHGLDDLAISDLSLIVIAPDENGLWRFTAETVEVIDELYDRWKDRPVVPGLVTSNRSTKPTSTWLEEQVPESLRGIHFLIADYKWFCILLVIFVGFLADALTRGMLNALTRTWFRFRHGESVPEMHKFWRPVGLFVQALVWYFGTTVIELPSTVLFVLLVGLKFFAIVAAGWMAFHFIDLIAAMLARSAEKTASKFDDLLIPLISRSIKVFVVCVGILVLADAFNVKVTGLLAGLGIGGMAVAFAAKDAISNLFGSVTVLLDRPFEVGDWVITSNVEGTVETVGFRSTRIRTFYNSLITLPNSVLTTAVVDNMGRRRFRRIKAMLGVQYDTTPEQIDAFCEGIRELIRRHPYTRKDYYHVYFNQFSSSSLDILLYCFVECPDWSMELREKHRLFRDILELAEKLGVSFAFPTRTLHMFQEPAAPSLNRSEFTAPEAAGQRLAARIAGQPLTLDQRPGGVEFRGPSPVDEDGNGR